MDLAKELGDNSTKRIRAVSKKGEPVRVLPVITYDSGA